MAKAVHGETHCHTGSLHSHRWHTLIFHGFKHKFAHCKTKYIAAGKIVWHQFWREVMGCLFNADLLLPLHQQATPRQDRIPPDLPDRSQSPLDWILLHSAHFDEYCHWQRQNEAERLAYEGGWQTVLCSNAQDTEYSLGGLFSMTALWRTTGFTIERVIQLLQTLPSGTAEAVGSRL